MFQKNHRPHETHNINKIARNCNPVTDKSDNDHDEMDNDNEIVEMKTQKLHPRQPRERQIMNSERARLGIHHVAYVSRRCGGCKFRVFISASLLSPSTASWSLSTPSIYKIAHFKFVVLRHSWGWPVSLKILCCWASSLWKRSGSLQNTLLLISVRARFQTHHFWCVSRRCGLCKYRAFIPKCCHCRFRHNRYRLRLDKTAISKLVVFVVGFVGPTVSRVDGLHRCGGFRIQCKTNFI